MKMTVIMINPDTLLSSKSVIGLSCTCAELIIKDDISKKVIRDISLAIMVHNYLHHNVC